MLHLKKITVGASTILLSGCCFLQNPDFAGRPVECLKRFDEVFGPTEYKGRVDLINCVDDTCQIISLITDEGNIVYVPEGGLERPIPIGTPVYSNDKKVCIDLGYDTSCAGY